jgi:glycerol-3-phosphate dehydrogenase
LVREEWARQAADIVYRRTKLGLRMTVEEIAILQQYLNGPMSLGDAPVDQRITRLASDVDSAQMA